MAETPHLALNLLEQSQAQKEVTMNEALMRVDALLNTGAEDKDLASPPVSPNAGDVYIIPTGASGDWAAKDGQIAYFEQIWRFIAPNAGMALWVKDEARFYVFNGTGWQAYPEVISELQNLASLGISGTADSYNRLLVSSPAALFTHAGDSMRINLNKNAAGDTASFTFQTGYSGRAEFGLTGSDNFSFKVTPDNFSTNYEAFVIEASSGITRFKEPVETEKTLSVKERLRLPGASFLTISAGAVTITKSHHKIDTESAATTDDLTTINGGQEGDMLVLEAADYQRTVVIKHAQGNIRNFSGTDVVLDDYGKAATYFYDGFNWIAM